MQKRKFDELISHFNCKVSDMSIDQKHKMELLGMISAIGFAHEKELSTNLAEVGTDCISRQAAIVALGTITVYKGSIPFDTAMMRIEQLPPANCSEFPNNSDTISRQAAIEAVMECYDNDELFEVYEEKLRELPPAQPERIKGRWISADAIFGGEPFYCSECGENTRDTVMGKPRWNFCPNCGADMREVTE